MTSEVRHTHELRVTDDMGEHLYILSNPVYLIGKTPECEIQINSFFASRRHATLTKKTHEDGTCYYRIEDGVAGKPSTNGLAINGRKCKARDLQNGDCIVFGPKVEARYTRRDRPPIDPRDVTLPSPDMLDETLDHSDEA